MTTTTNCSALHDDIRDGLTTLKCIGVQEDGLGERLALYICPCCNSSIAQLLVEGEAV